MEKYAGCMVFRDFPVKNPVFPNGLGGQSIKVNATLTVLPMKRIKFGFRNQSATNTLQLCERAVRNLATLPPEQLVDVPQAELAATVAATRVSHNLVASLRADLKAEISRRNQLLRAARTQTTHCVNGAALKMNNDPVKMMATGFGLHTPWAKASPPGAPTNLRAEPTASAGEAQLRWRRPMREGWFEIELQLGEFRPDGWQLAEVACFRQSCRLTGLVSGALYWFRVRARNRRGPGPWCELATARVR